MENLETFFDLIDHPEKYTQEEIEAILENPENREFYNLLCKTESTVKANKAADVETEWKLFSEKHKNRGEKHKRRRIFFPPTNRAASIAAIVLVSIGAVTAGIGITAVLKDRDPHSANLTEAVQAKGEITFATLTDTITESDDSIGGQAEPLVFENESLRVILNKIAEIYDTDVVINNEEVAELKLFFKLDPALPLKEVVDRLNTFEQISISLKENTITVN